MKLSQLNEAAKEKATKGLGLSLSKIKTHENCPYKYYLQYLAKEKYDKEDYNPKFFKVGQFAHKWIESKIKGTACEFNSSTLTDEDKSNISGNCAKVFDNDYVKSILGKGESEKEFSMYINPSEIDGLEAKGKASRSADFQGYIDYYAKTGSLVHIVDWKTGSKKGKDDDTFMQLFLYAKACQKLHGGTKFKLSFYYIDHNKLVTRELNLSELNTKIETIVNKGINIPTQKNPNMFPAKPGWMCKYCPYSKVRSSDKKIPCEFTNPQK